MAVAPRTRARVAAADGPAADGVATWHGAVLDSSVRGGAAPLARFVDELLLSVAARRDARNLNPNAVGLADDHSTAKDVPFFFREKKGSRVAPFAPAPSSPSSSAMNPFAFASPSKGDRVSPSLFVPEKRRAATREKRERCRVPKPSLSGATAKRRRRRKKVRFAPEAPEVFAAKRNGATTKQTSGSVRPPPETPQAAPGHLQERTWRRHLLRGRKRSETERASREENRGTAVREVTRLFFCRSTFPFPETFVYRRFRDRKRGRGDFARACSTLETRGRAETNRDAV